MYAMANITLSLKPQINIHIVLTKTIYNDGYTLVNHFS